MRYVLRGRLARMAFANSSKMPQTVNDGGVRRQWVGIGWVSEGPADGTEEAIVIDSIPTEAEKEK